MYAGTVTAFRNFSHHSILLCTVFSVLARGSCKEQLVLSQRSKHSCMHANYSISEEQCRAKSISGLAQKLSLLYIHVTTAIQSRTYLTITSPGWCEWEGLGTKLAHALLMQCPFALFPSALDLGRWANTSRIFFHVGWE